MKRILLAKNYIDIVADSLAAIIPLRCLCWVYPAGTLSIRLVCWILRTHDLLAGGRNHNVLATYCSRIIHTLPILICLLTTTYVLPQQNVLFSKYPPSTLTAILLCHFIAVFKPGTVEKNFFTLGLRIRGQIYSYKSINL